MDRPIEYLLERPLLAVPALFLVVLSVFALALGRRFRLRVLLLGVAGALPVVGVAVLIAHYVPAAPAPVLRADSRDLRSTVIVATERAPAPAGKNVLWCASFQLAWDAFRQNLFAGGRVPLGSPAPAELVAALNDAPFPPGDLDSSAYVAAAGYARDGIARRFDNEAERKFGGDADDVELPELEPEDAAAFALLVKELPFAHPFETFESGLRFAGSERTVRAFGMNQHSDNPGKAAILGQVRVHLADVDGEDHALARLRPDRFVIELSLRGGRDRLLLARIDPAPTLRETWEKARDAAAGPGRAASDDTILAIPKINLDVCHRFAELEGGRLGNAHLVHAFQRTQFRLDETGARLKSFAAIQARLGIDPCYLFDRPFLVALVQKGATRPYFLLWIANDELLTLG